MIANHKAAVSLCMIVRNETHQLADCLEPVAALFDEIIIVDTGSTDGTMEIARRFTPHVCSFPWCDDFSAARNASLARASGDWVMWLDADDRLNKDQVSKLRQLLTSLDDRRLAYLMDTACPSADVSSGDWVLSHPRLFRRHPQLRWEGRVHEQLWPSATALGYEMAPSDVRIEHLGYLSATLEQRKLRRNVRLLQMDYAIDPTNPSTLVHLGLAHFKLGNNAEAKKNLQAIHPHGLDHYDPFRRANATLSEIARREGDFHGSLQFATRGLIAFPGDAELMFHQAQALYELRQFEAAKNILMSIVSEPSSSKVHDGMSADIRLRLAPRRLAEVLRAQGALSAAEGLLLRVVERFTADTLSWHALSRIYIDQRNRTKLDGVVERLRDCREGTLFGMLLLGVWHLLHDQFETAVPLVDRLIIESPRMPLPRLMRAELLVRAGASVESRLSAFRDVLRLQPGNLYVSRMIRSLEAALSATTPASPAWVRTNPVGAALPTNVSIT